MSVTDVRKPQPGAALGRVPWWRSLVIRVLWLPALMVLALVIFSVGWLQSNEEREAVERFGLILESTAATAAPFIRAKDIEAITPNADANSPSFERLRAALARIRADNDLGEDQIYILRREPDHRDRLRFVVMLQERTFIGDPYEPPRELRSTYDWVLDQNDAVRTPLYTSPNGMYISGIAPIIDETGRAVAVLQVDYGVDAYMAEVESRTRMMMGGAAGFMMILALIGLMLHRFLRLRFEALLSATDAIHREQYDHQIPVWGDDELAVVGRALNRTLRKLKERFEMLKFLPRHTARMIEAAAAVGGVSLDTGRNVRVVIMETDIRGFTRLVEPMSPNEIIKMLNIYIKAQAELIGRAGGSIDKYMGDAVLAIFEGPDIETRALDCAVAIQAEIARMNAAGVFDTPIKIGIGLSLGEVVMGNMGSDLRMEHTVIGQVVNLAARLCSAAKPGEILAAADLIDALADPSVYTLHGPESIVAKGFKTPVPCYSLPS